MSNTLLLLLSVVTTADEVHGFTRLMKLVFLTQRELSGQTPYTFRSGQYGPVSHAVSDDVERLVANGFLTTYTHENTVGDTVTVYSATQKGARAVRNAIRDGTYDYNQSHVDACVNTYNNMPLWDMFDYLGTYYTGAMRNSEVPTTQNTTYNYKPWTNNVQDESFVPVCADDTTQECEKGES